MVTEPTSQDGMHSYEETLRERIPWRKLSLRIFLGEAGHSHWYTSYGGLRVSRFVNSSSPMHALHV